MDTKKKILSLIAEVCGVEADTLKSETELVADLGIDSARALHLLVKLEDALEIEIDDEKVADLQTVGDVVSLIDGETSAVSE